MEERILESIKNELKRHENEKAKCQKIVERIEELKKYKEVREYIKCIEFLNNVDYDEAINFESERVLNSIIRKFIDSIKETNEIYVYLGTFMAHSFGMDFVTDIKVGKDSPKADFREYRNIEGKISVNIPIKECEKFEKEHKVVYPRDDFHYREFWNLQKKFFKIAIENGQEIACEKILNGELCKIY